MLQHGVKSVLRCSVKCSVVYRGRRPSWGPKGRKWRPQADTMAKIKRTGNTCSLCCHCCNQSVLPPSANKNLRNIQRLKLHHQQKVSSINASVLYYAAILTAGRIFVCLSVCQSVLLPHIDPKLEYSL